jgi:primosomal protein N' (replication factor Y)
MVRVSFHGRRVGGWVVGLADRPATDKPLQPILRVSGLGPPPEVLELTEWAGWRWAGRRSALLRTASPRGMVPALPPPSRTPAPPTSTPSALVGDAFTRPLSVVRMAPAEDPLPFVVEAAARTDALVLAPSLSAAGYLAARLRRLGHPVAVVPREWAQAAARAPTATHPPAAAWAPRPRLGAVVVLDEHDEGYQEERAPTWNARDVAVERARRAAVPCVLTSPCPSLQALGTAELLLPARADERAGWPVVEVVDRRQEPPGSGLYSERLVAVLRRAEPGDRVVCVLNRKGRARLLACAGCGELARCERCDGAVSLDGDELQCRRCGAARPPVCLVCSGTRLKTLRAGVSRVREELELLAGRPVAEVTAETDPGQGPPDAPVLVGTEAVLHRLAGARVVAFLDLDQELLASRYRAAEAALALLARAARVVGGRSGGGRLLLQTRLPSSEVIDAAVHADPARLAVVEAARRAALRLPPEVAMALVSGEAAPAYADALSCADGVEVLGPSRGRWLVRAPDHGVLCGALAATPRPAGRLRVEVDPLRA